MKKIVSVLSVAAILAFSASSQATVIVVEDFSDTTDSL